MWIGWLVVVFRRAFAKGEDDVLALLIGVTVCRGECMRGVIRLKGELDIGAEVNPSPSSKVKP